MITCTKMFHNFPFAHRQPEHKGHCHFIHGHNWAFKFTFAAHQLDVNQFVIDFGSLGWLKNFLNEMFDHTLVLNLDDPELEHIRDSIGKTDLALIRCVRNCGAEGLAEFLFRTVNEMLEGRTAGRVYITEVAVFEDDKNSATYSEKGACNCA